MIPTEPFSILEQAGCQYAFYFSAPGAEPFFRTSPGRDEMGRFLSASIIKVPVLLAWVHLERAGLVSRAELCDLDSEPQVRGSGFAWLLHGRKIPFADVLLMMIATSDNLCTNLVINRIGLERLNRVFSETLGLRETALQRKLFDYEARARGLDNWISPADCIRFYEQIAALEPAERAWVESMLAANTDDALLMRSIPRDTVVFCHKTGSITGVLHDWGYTEHCKMFLLTQNVADEQVVFPVFGRLGELLMRPQK